MMYFENLRFLWTANTPSFFDYLRSCTIPPSPDLCSFVVNIAVHELSKAFARVQHRMIPASLTSESVRLRYDLCCKRHFSLCLGATFENLTFAFS